MDRGQLQAALKQLTQQRFLPPRAKTTRSYSVATLERWYYGFKKRGLPGLRIPGHADHRFRRMPISDSDACRSPIPAHPDR